MDTPIVAPRNASCFLGTIVSVFPPFFYTCCSSCRRKNFDDACCEGASLIRRFRLGLVVSDRNVCRNLVCFGRRVDMVVGCSVDDFSERFSEYPDSLATFLLGKSFCFFVSQRQSFLVDSVAARVSTGSSIPCLIQPLSTDYVSFVKFEKSEGSAIRCVPV